jgi:hypothetical protein
MNKLTPNQITIACRNLESALMADYNAMEANQKSGVLMKKTHNDVVIALGEIRDLKNTIV